MDDDDDDDDDDGGGGGQNIFRGRICYGWEGGEIRRLLKNRINRRHLSTKGMSSYKCKTVTADKWRQGTLSFSGGRRLTPQGIIQP